MTPAQELRLKLNRYELFAKRCRAIDNDPDATDEDIIKLNKQIESVVHEMDVTLELAHYDIACKKAGL